MRSLLTLLVGTASVLAAQQGGAASAVKSGVIEGRVQNAVTGEPVKNTHLLLHRAGVSPNGTHSPTNYSASTDENGRFALKEIEPGNYRLVAMRLGFVSTEFGSREPMGVGTILSVDPAQHSGDIVFRLTPHAVISGHVIDEQGEPMPFVQVQAMGYHYNWGRRQLSSFGGAATNDLGEYRIFGLAPGHYYLNATYRPNAPFETVAGHSADKALDEDYMPVYYPRGADPTLATPIETTAGVQLAGIDFALSKSRTVHMRGRVNNNTNGRGMITVMLAPTEQTRVLGMSRTYPTDPQGNFHIRGIVPGAYTFIASVLDSNGSLTAKRKLDLSSSVENFNIAMPPAMELTGRVRVEGDQRPNLSYMRVSLRPHEPNAIFGPLPNARVKEDGSFTLSNISPDNYNVIALELPDGYYIKSVRVGDEDVLDAGVNLSGDSVGAINIILSPGAGQVEGAVLKTEGQTAAGATVVLIPQTEKRRDQMQFYKTATADEQGRFTLGNVDPGKYKLFAWEDIQFDAWMDQDFVKPFEVKGEAVTIGENSREKVQLKVIPVAAAHEGRIGKTP